MSSFQLTALALIGNPRQFAGSDKPRSILLDAELFLGPNPEASCALRFYNAHDIDFGNGTLCFMQATVTKVHSVAKLGPFELRDEDYDFVGDITYLIPVTDHSAVDPRHQPWVHVSGTVLEANKKLSTFKLSPNQWVPMEQSSNTIPILATIPDSPKYTEGRNKPMPQPGSIVSFSGYLTRIAKPAAITPTQKDLESENKETNTLSSPSTEWMFFIDVVHLTFLGRDKSVSNTPSTPETGNTFRKRKLGVSFNDWDSPSPAPGKKRKENVPPSKPRA